MAIAYLNSTTSFAAANWSDATGFATAADLVINIQGLNVQTGLDQTGITDGIDSLDIEAAATGIIGGSGASLEVEANTGLARITNKGNVTLYLAAKGLVGATDHITSFACGGTSTNYLTGGGFTNVTVQSGICNVKAATVVTNFYANGGSGTIQANATALTTAYILGGTWTIQRAVTTLFVGPNATVIYDGNNGGSGYSVTTANLFHKGRLATRSGNIATLNKYGGTLDSSVVDRALTVGGTAFTNYTGVPQEADALVTVSNETFPGASQKVAEPLFDG